MMQRPPDENAPSRISPQFRGSQGIGDASNQGIRDAMIRHEKLGESVVVWRDGRIVWLTADEIPVNVNEPTAPTVALK